MLRQWALVALRVECPRSAAQAQDNVGQSRAEQGRTGGVPRPPLQIEGGIHGTEPRTYEQREAQLHEMEVQDQSGGEDVVSGQHHRPRLLQPYHIDTKKSITYLPRQRTQTPVRSVHNMRLVDWHPSTTLRRYHAFGHCTLLPLICAPSV